MKYCVLVKQLPLKPHITLGNHDLHLLNRLFGNHPHVNSDDSLHAILVAEDREELGHWLRQQSILHHDQDLNVVMCHAGIPPVWDLAEAKEHAVELESALRGEHYQNFFSSYVWQ